MDLACFLARHQNALSLAGAAACVASRASHRARAAEYAKRIQAIRDLAIAA